MIRLRAQRFWLTATFGVAVAAMAASASACRIPVFRYALERWPPGTFEFVLIHSGELSDDDATTLRRIEAQVHDKDRPANMRVETIDTADQELSDEQRELCQLVGIKAGNLTSPHAILLFPASRGHRAVAWHGEFSFERIASVIDSPARQQIAEMILDGESAVWVLIESSNKAANDAAAERLDAELGRMTELISLPPKDVLEADEEFQAGTGIELRIGFRSIRLNKTDPTEAPFIQMLLHTEPDLVTYDEPIVIPIYGRGRTYYALVGKGIKPNLIEENSRFVCGDCSCQVKEENPGSDLLFAVNWDEGIRGTAFPTAVLPELTGIGSLDVIDLGEYERHVSSEADRMRPAATRRTDDSSSRNGPDPAYDERGTSPEKDSDVATRKPGMGQPDLGKKNRDDLIATETTTSGGIAEEAQIGFDASDAPAVRAPMSDDGHPVDDLDESETGNAKPSPVARSMAPALGLAFVIALLGGFLLKS